MKKKTRVYLDTSVISVVFDERNPERKLHTETFFREIGNLCSPEIFDYIYSHEVNSWKAKIWSVERTEGEIHCKA